MWPVQGLSQGQSASLHDPAEGGGGAFTDFVCGGQRTTPTTLPEVPPPRQAKPPPFPAPLPNSQDVPGDRQQ